MQTGPSVGTADHPQVPQHTNQQPVPQGTAAPPAQPTAPQTAVEPYTAQHVAQAQAQPATDTTVQPQARRSAQETNGNTPALQVRHHNPP
jgi:hypothetical protein